MDIFIISQDITHTVQQENTEICEQKINNIFNQEMMKGLFGWFLLAILSFQYSSIQCSNIQIVPIKQQTGDHNTIIEDFTSPVTRKIKQSPNSQTQNGSLTKKVKNQLTKQVMKLIYKQNQIKIRTQSLNQVQKYLVTNQFKGIGLYHSVPSYFVEGEVYRFFGIVLNQSLLTSRRQAQYNFVNIVFSDLNGKLQFRCIQKMTQSLQFDISCRMQKQGIFFLSIFAGIQGQSSAKLRSIRSYVTLFETLKYNVVAPQPNNISLQIQNNSLFVVWDSIASLTNITIFQENGNKKQYLLSNFHEKYEIPFADFNNFKNKQKTLLQISHAESLDGSLSLKSTKYSQVLIQIQFYPQQHFFHEEIEGMAQWQTQLPWKMPIDSKFNVNVTFKQNVNNQVFIIYPDLSIKTLYFIQPLINMSTTVIQANNWVQLQLIFRLPGLHVIQINCVSGLAIINRPIYVGHTYPLIPDYIDLQPEAYNPIKNVSLIDIYRSYYQKTTARLGVKQPSLNSSIQQKIMYVLQLLNGLRKKYKVDIVELDQQLNKIAQTHADNIKNASYFSHINSKGEGPKERAIKMGFTESIGQNIAKAKYLTEAHLGLQRSASHLENSINEIWSRVGVGITFTQDIQYIIVFQFSTRDFKKYPLTIKQKQKMKIDFMILVRQQNPNIVNQDRELSSDIQSWIQSNKSIKMYEYLMEKSSRGARDLERPMIGTSYIIIYSKNWASRLKNSNYLSGFREFSEVGIGIDYSQDSTNKVEIYIIFA